MPRSWMTLATGSWNSTIPSDSSAKITPISRSLTPATFFANAGSSSTISAIVAAMKTAFSAVTDTNVRSRATAVQLPRTRPAWSGGTRRRDRTSA